ncbi:unnamed protein product [Phyllotreta striolata]|uniref:Transthyretin/hydroxyisourate hydrolase domain-containing protein n=1 Tax=Phyllotreta striolata TaxID=444603 RepID=A0A9P0GWA3_PHYSR|nr:unnamed protein product [Phyllotreta striolata]
MSSRSKNYKQKYRPAWEEMPIFRDWLRRVEGEPRKAFCKLCSKTLIAHRLSLLKHCQTTSHKNAERDKSHKNPERRDNDEEMLNEEESEEESEEEEREEQTSDQNVQQNGGADRPPISTHVTNMINSQPICGLKVRLFKFIENRWIFVNEGTTNSSGKFNEFIQRNDFTTGRYKLNYKVNRYFESKRMETVHPFIEVKLIIFF